MTAQPRFHKAHGVTGRSPELARRPPSRPATLPDARRPYQLLGAHGAGGVHRPGPPAPRVTGRPPEPTALAVDEVEARQAGRTSGGGGRRYSPGTTAPITASRDGPGAGRQLLFPQLTNGERRGGTSHPPEEATSGTRHCGKRLGFLWVVRGRPGSVPVSASKFPRSSVNRGVI